MKLTTKRNSINNLSILTQSKTHVQKSPSTLKISNSLMLHQNPEFKCPLESLGSSLWFRYSKFLEFSFWIVVKSFNYLRSFILSKEEFQRHLSHPKIHNSWTVDRLRMCKYPWERWDSSQHIWCSTPNQNLIIEVLDLPSLTVACSQVKFVVNA
jgi:hypothetical protein